MDEKKTISIPKKVFDELMKDKDFVSKQNLIREKYGFNKIQKETYDKIKIIFRMRTDNLEGKVENYIIEDIVSAKGYLDRIIKLENNSDGECSYEFLYAVDLENGKIYLDRKTKLDIEMRFSK